MSNLKKNKFESNKKYFTISIYTLFVIAIGTVLIKSIISWNLTKASMHNIFNMLSPFLIGSFIAYLLNPIVRKIDSVFLHKICRISSSRLRKVLSLLLSYLIVIGILFLFILYVVPQLLHSLSDLTTLIPDLYQILYAYINDLEKNYPNIDFDYINLLLENYEPNFIDWVRNFATNAIPLIYNTSISLLRWLYNFIMAFIFSIYMLSDKNLLKNNCKRFLYAVFQKNHMDRLFATLTECNHIFSGFIVGKTIDSFIIGILCFILMSIFRIPYPLVISTFVGITNMIPYFGPFIGAVPGIIILLLISPIKAFGFIILVLLLQQFDGLFLGPKILGDSTGLKPLWIIFAISIGGSLGGIAGMFFGVPITAVISFLLNNFIARKLKEKELVISDSSDVPFAESTKPQLKSSSLPEE